MTLSRVPRASSSLTSNSQARQGKAKTTVNETQNYPRRGCLFASEERAKVLSSLKFWHFLGEFGMRKGRFSGQMAIRPPVRAMDFADGTPIRDVGDYSAFSWDLSYSGPPVRSFETQPPRKMTAFRDFPANTEVFLSVFPEFDSEAYSKALLEGCIKRGWFYCCKFSQCDLLDGDDRIYAHCLMAAHIIVLTTRQRAVANANNGTVSGLPTGVKMVGGSVSSTGQMGTTGIVTNASIGGESIGLTLPQSQNAWEFWLNQTTYGLEYQAFMSSHVPVGVYAEGDDLRMCLRD